MFKPTKGSTFKKLEKAEEMLPERVENAEEVIKAKSQDLDILEGQDLKVVKPPL